MKFNRNMPRVAAAGTGAGLALSALLTMTATPALADDAQPEDQVAVQVWHDLAPTEDVAPTDFEPGEPLTVEDVPVVVIDDALIDLYEPPVEDISTGEEDFSGDDVGDGGWTDEGWTDEGWTDEGQTDEGQTDEGQTDEGQTDGGLTDEAAGDDGASDDSAGDDGWTDENAGDPEIDDWTNEGTAEEQGDGSVDEEATVIDDPSDVLVGICGWAVGTEPSGPCNGDGIEGDWTIVYMMNDVGVTPAVSDKSLESGAGAGLAHRQPALRAPTLGAYSATDLASCLGLYPDLPWICEWQYGVD